MTADEDDGVDHLEPDPPGPAGRRLLLLGTAAVVVAALVLAVTLARPEDQTAPVPSPTPAATDVASPTPRPERDDPGADDPRGDDPRGDDAAPVEGSLGRPLLPGADPAWELFAQTATELHRIELATGDFTRTASRVAGAPGRSAVMAVGAEEVLIQSVRSGTADLVRDGEPGVRVLFDETLRGGRLIPGPDGTVWQVSGPADDELTLSRFTLDGEQLTGAQALPGLVGWGAATSDGAGGVLVSGVGGAWLLDEEQPPRRVTRGLVVATGPRVLVTVDCDDRLRCQRRVFDRRTGAERVLGPALQDGATSVAGSAVTSPDGRWLVEPGSFQRGGFRVVDLGTNREVAAVESELGFADPGASVVWTPDNRLLLVAEGRLVVVDPVAGRSVSPDVELAGVRRIALRS